MNGVLAALMYAAQSLGRAGLDFRPLLPPLFEPLLLQQLQRRCDAAVAAFGAALEAYSWVRLPELPQSAHSGGGSASTLAAPFAVMQFPPLSVLLNGLLGALNELRQCAPLALAAGAREALRGALAVAAAVLVARGGCLPPATLGRDFPDMCELLAAEVFAHVGRCYGLVFEAAAAEGAGEGGLGLGESERLLRAVPQDSAASIS